MKRDLVIAGLAAAAIGAMSIPAIVDSLGTPLDSEIRSMLGTLHAARSRGDHAFDVEFGGDGRPLGGRVEIDKADYIVTIDQDGRVSVRMR